MQHPLTVAVITVARGLTFITIYLYLKYVSGSVNETDGIGQKYE